MAAIDPGTLMWARACELIDRAERLHRQFFQPRAVPVRDLCWEPPVDVIETDSDFLISVALPGVNSNAVKVTVENGTVMVTGFPPGQPPPPAAAGFIGWRFPTEDSNAGSPSRQEASS